MNFKIDRGLDIHLKGVALPEVEVLPTASLCFIRPSDFRWLKPHLLIAEGDTVEVGTPLFADKAVEQIRIVSPVTGKVKAIVRGEKRLIQCIVIEVQADAPIQQNVDFEEPKQSKDFRELMLRYGLWPCLRQRPYATIPTPDSQPKAIFISCFDTAPLAPSYSILMQGMEEDFHAGLHILQQVTGTNIPIHLSFGPDTDIALDESLQNIHIHHFSGPHPAGNVGPQIHRIAPLDKGESVWYVHPLDVARIGRFFKHHCLSFDTRFALTGSAVIAPKYYQTVYGADLSQLLERNTKQEKANDDEAASLRFISGNVLTGTQTQAFPSVGFYEHQLTVLPEGGQRELLGWLLPGLKKWSLSHTFIAWLNKHKTFNFNTSQHGDQRNFVMTDVYDQVFPFDNILPLELLKACLTHDYDKMEELGIYEVDSEDFALCELVCPSKTPCQEIIKNGLFEVKN